MFDIDSRAEFDALGERDRLIAELLARPDETLFVAKPAVSGWSPADHLYHMLLINGGVYRTVGKLMQPDAPTACEPSDLARSFMAGSGFPRGRIQAPETVRPPADLNRAGLDRVVALSARSRASTEPLLGQLAALPTALPHPLLGPITAPAWLRFARIHTDHHLAIIGDIDRA